MLTRRVRPQDDCRAIRSPTTKPLHYSCGPVVEHITLFILAVPVLIFLSCGQHKEQSNTKSFGPKVVEAIGYVVPKDSMAEPRVILVDESKLKKIPAGKPTVFPTNTNVHLAGTPNVVTAGKPRVCTPGQDTFLIPKTVPAIDSPFVAGIPEVVTAKDAYTKDQNPQNFSSFGKLQGLKHGHIYCLFEDKSGNLWFGTRGGGVSRYDGKSFTHFTDKEGLGNNFVMSILEDKSGNLWFGTQGDGVSRYDGKSFTHFTDKEGLSNNFVLSILEDKSGNLWFGTGGGGVSRYDGKSFTHFTDKEGLSNNDVWSILEDKSGNLWFGTAGGGVSRYDGKSFTHFTDKEGLSYNYVWSIIEDRDGNLWFGTYGGGVSRYDGKSLPAGQASFTHFTDKEGLSNNFVTSILEDKSGNLWFGTEGGGVSRYDPSAKLRTGSESFTHFTDKEGLSNNFVWSMLQDKSGNLWFGTGGGGVSRYDGKSFTHFTDKEGLSNNDVRIILEDKSGNLWFGAHGEGVSRYDGKSFTHFTDKEGLGTNYVLSILEDKSGNLWFGTTGGVSRYDGKSFTHFTDKEGLGTNHVLSILEDKSGNLWFGTRGGVSRYDGKSFTHFTDKEGLSNNVVSSILEDKSGNLWFGTEGGGVSRYDPSAKLRTGSESFTHFTDKEGLSNNDVRSILEDKSGNLWFGTEGGVSRYDPSAKLRTGSESFTHFTDKEGLGNNEVVSILEDKSGNLWFGTRFGLSKFTKPRLVEILALSGVEGSEKVKSGTVNESNVFFINYTYEDGFLGVGCIRKSICEDRNGTIWIGANDRLTAYHPEGDVPDTIAPNLQLTSIALYNEMIPWSDIANHQDSTIRLSNGVQVRNFTFDSTTRWHHLPENLSLAYNNNYLTFHFIGITQKSPKKVKYQYKLEGNDESWSALSPFTEAHYGNLPHGTYTFKVKAMNSEGYWSNEYHYSFKIRPPWWLTWWAYSLYGIATVTLLWRLHRFQQARTIRIEREKTRQRELEQAKEIEMAYTELKETQAQLIQREKMASLGELTAGIAHEIQNPLNFVNNFSEVNTELIDDLEEEINQGNMDSAKEIARDIRENEQKIVHHGKRADAIVKGMLQHSRTSSGVKEPTDINALADEYLRLAYHGLRAKDKSFNATMKTDFDETIGNINIISQDIGRVILNLITNAFYAVTERNASTSSATAISLRSVPEPVEGPPYQPTVTVSTKNLGDKIEVRVKDNGNGIPQHILDKIFQPFFTTKPTGQGTGLGLSLSYDIVRAHGGELKVETKEAEGSEFIVKLPF